MSDSPNLENGYTRLANELLEAITRGNFTKVEYKIIFSIVRLTYGFGKKHDRISLSILQGLTGINKGNLSRIVSKLVDKKVINSKHFGQNRSLGLNKHYTKWRISGALRVAAINAKESSLGVVKTTTLNVDHKVTKGCQNNNQRVVKTTTKGLSKQQPQKKERNERKPLLNTCPFSKNDFEVIFEKFWEVYPRKDGKKAALRAWLKIKLDQKLIDTIFLAVSETKKLKWDHSENKFIPHASTWINGERWRDEISDERKAIGSEDANGKFKTVGEQFRDELREIHDDMQRNNQAGDA